MTDKKSVLKVLAYASLISAAFIFMFGISGCQGQSTDNKNVGDQQPLDRRIGILKSLGGVKTSNKGTHLLQLDDGSTILLKSAVANLDDAMYLNNTVEVRGTLTYTTDGKQVMEVMNIDKVDVTASQEVAKAEWKDYASTALNVSIRYSNILKVSEEDGAISFERSIEPDATTALTEENVEDSPVTQATQVTQSTQEGTVIHKLKLSAEKKAEDKTLADKLGVTSISGTTLAAKGMSESKIGSGNYDAVKKPDGNIVYYYIDADDYIYTITMDCGQDKQTIGDQNMFYEMLGTLKINSVLESDSLNADTINNAATQDEDDSVKEKDEVKEPEVKDVVPVKVVEETKKVDETVVTTKEPVVVPVSDTATESADSSSAQTQETIEGFGVMESGTYNFSVQYPKSWFYSGSASDESGVVRHYEFGTKPIDEVAGDVSLDVMSGTMPSGSGTVTGNVFTLYVKGEGSRIYRITGPANMESTLRDIAGSIK
jgi:hypothetical protein